MKYLNPGSYELQQVRRVLKRILKDRKITYRELSRSLRMSESGVKKLFSGADLSLTRLSQICGVLHLSLGDLLSHTNDEDFPELRFTPAQQEYLLAHRDCLRFFWKLAFERLSLAETQQSLGLSARATEKYVTKLDRLGLLQLHPGGRIKVPPLAKARSFGDGPMIRALYREWGLQMMHDLASPDPGEGAQFIIRFLKMKKSTYLEFLQSLRQVEAEFLNRAIREMQMSPAELVPMRWVSAADSRSFLA